MSPPMRFGVVIPHFRHGASASGIRDVAQAAERLGFDAVWVTDRAAVPSGPVRRQFGPPFYDPLVTLSYLAGVTSRVRLGASVFVLPFRHPVLMARALASIDQASGGRLIVGVGAGWMREEFAAIGVPFERRGRLTDEYLDVMITLWQNPVASFHGPTVQFSDLVSEPRTVQQPRPPILVGGGTPAAIRRTVRFGDGWHGSPAPLPALQHAVTMLHEELRANSRDPAGIALSTRAPLAFRGGRHRGDTDGSEPVGAPDEVVAAIHRYAAAGFTELAFDTFFEHPALEDADASPEHILRTLELFARAVMPAFRAPAQR